MSFPRKFKHLLEIEQGDIETPDYVWLTYAVCAVTPDGCVWSGWMIEAAFKKTGERHPTGTGHNLLSATDRQVCPRCGKETFRTRASVRMEPTDDQKAPHGEPGVDYDVVAIEYED